MKGLRRRSGGDGGGRVERDKMMVGIVKGDDQRGGLACTRSSLYSEHSLVAYFRAGSN